MVEDAKQTGEYTFTAKGPYDFAASVRFWEGFSPAAYDSTGKIELRLAFPADADFSLGAAYVTPGNDAGTSIRIQTYGAASPEVVRDQSIRVLSLDIDGTGFEQVVRDDAVLDRIWDRYHGIRPVLFYSPYEAAAWAVIGNRIRISQAAMIKRAMADQLGESITMHGTTVHAFPRPDVLLTMSEFRGLGGRKVEYLHAVATAALAGTLDPLELRSVTPEDALARLESIKGIGPFGAELTLIRGAGPTDRLPAEESRLARAVGLAYDLEHEPGAEAIREIADAWRPYRTWATVMLRTFLEDETHEISGTAPRDKEHKT